MPTPTIRWAACASPPGSSAGSPRASSRPRTRAARAASSPITEGGYDLAALRDSATAVARVLAGEADLGDFARPEGPTPRADATIAAVRPGLATHWRL